ncbi:hypothetical protein PILCRDRAFT_828844, partial [Piloderma croceum F 1598]
MCSANGCKGSANAAQFPYNPIFLPLALSFVEGEISESDLGRLLSKREEKKCDI